MLQVLHFIFVIVWKPLRRCVGFQMPSARSSYGTRSVIEGAGSLVADGSHRGNNALESQKRNQSRSNPLHLFQDSGKFVGCVSENVLASETQASHDVFFFQ